MMLIPSSLQRDDRAAAATEMALVLPLLLTLMFGAAEMGNYFMSQHAVTKAVRDGSRFAGRLQLKTEDYLCDEDDTGNIWEAPDAETQIKNVVMYGTVDTSGTGRFEEAAWGVANQCGTTPIIDIAPRCVDPDDAEIAGIYAALDGEIPVVKVSAAIKYKSILSNVGVDLEGVCLRAESETPVTGL